MACAKVISAVEVLDVGDTARRRHWDDAEKIRIVEESLRGHRQGSATARRYGISRSLLTVWRRQYRDGLLSAALSAAFVPLAIRAEDPPRTVASPEPPVHAPPRAEIVLLNGRRLIVPIDAAPDAVRRLLAVVDEA